MDDEHAIGAELRNVTSLRAIEALALDEERLATANRVLDLVEAELLLARGRTTHAIFVHGGAADQQEIFLFKRAQELCREVGDVHGEAEAEFWIGTFHQTLTSDDDKASVHLERSRELAIQAGDQLILSCVERHLGFVDIRARRFPEAKNHLARSVVLRRQVGFDAGVASGLVALAELALDMGDDAEADRLLAEATELATEVGADGILRVIEELQTRH